MTNKFSGLTLKPTKPIKNTFRLVIQGDTNDGDYVQETTEWTNFDEFKDYLPLISKIGNQVTNLGDRMSSKDRAVLTDDEDDQLYEICPYGDYGLTSLEVLEFVYFDENGDSFDVGFQPEFYL